MTNALKKNLSTSQDVIESNDRPLSYNNHSNNRKASNVQDDYQSDRFSTESFHANTRLSKQVDERNPNQKKQPHTLRYDYNELPSNGVPYASQYKEAQKQEKQRQKAIRKAPPGQGNLVPFPEAPANDLNNYYPYWYYYKAKNPDWIMRHRQTTDGQIVPYESLDLSQYIQPPAISSASAKTRRKSKHHRNKSTAKNNLENQYAPEQYPYPYPYPYYGQYYGQSLPQNSKLKSEYDWHNHYVQSMANKPIQDINSYETNSPGSKHHPHRHHHQQQRRSAQTDQANGQKHHRHHHHHHHHRHRHHNEQQQHSHVPQNYTTEKEFDGAQFKVVDMSFKKFERTPFFQPMENINSSPPAIYGQNYYLPPISHSYYHRPESGRQNIKQTFENTSSEPIETPRNYKATTETSFYDRYLNNIISTKLGS